MGFIRKVGIDEAEGRLKRIYDAGIKRVGYVGQIIQIMSLDPLACEGSMRFYVSLMKSENALEASTREMLAAVVSNANDCYY